MGDLSQFTDADSATVRAIYDWHKKRGDAEPVRGYLGASIIGHECDRFLWFTFRGCVARKLEGRMYRLFETGNLAEDRFTRELAGIGCKVKTRDENGEQFAVYAVGGHFSGHLDGVCLDLPEAPKTWHLCEYKTHNAKSFEKLRAVGVKAAKPMHFAQMQVYMALADLERALYLATGKDTDELYAERIKYEPKTAKAILARAKAIITASATPERLTTRPDDFRCKFCDAIELCWGTGTRAVPIPDVNCRTCCHSTPVVDDSTAARWSCAKGCLNITQGDACRKHLLLPGLISFAEPVNAGDDWIELKNTRDGAVWRHGDGSGGTWSSKELISVPGPLVGEKTAGKAKALFDGTVTAVEEGIPPKLVDRYPPGESRLLWEGSPDAKDAMSAALAKALCKTPDTITDPTETQDDDEHTACEFDGKFCLVIYKQDNYAALWEGVE